MYSSMLRPLNPVYTLRFWVLTTATVFPLYALNSPLVNSPSSPTGYPAADDWEIRYGLCALFTGTQGIPISRASYDGYAQPKWCISTGSTWWLLATASERSHGPHYSRLRAAQFVKARCEFGGKAAAFSSSDLHLRQRRV
ncbi:hypothetical protein DL769_007602 [Monosporascus sp. CRB-8-3]|nr:hypothetical protein DL769_007602 [Monosporascus sp. CRB-8-3]